MQLRDFLDSYSDCFETPKDDLYLLTKECIDNHKAQKPYPDSVQSILERWYQSLDSAPDYSVYSDELYFCDVWICWITTSRNHIKNIFKQKSRCRTSFVETFTDVDSVFDVGCGLGLSTLGLKQIFPYADVTGSNIKGSFQYEIASRIGSENDFTIQEELQPADLLFASEYFEHFHDPIAELNRIIEQVNPKYIILSNGFHYRAIGHFNKYQDSGTMYDNKGMSKHFNKTIKQYYDLSDLRYYNNNPRIFTKKSNKISLDNFM